MIIKSFNSEYLGKWQVVLIERQARNLNQSIIKGEL